MAYFPFLKVAEGLAKSTAEAVFLWAGRLPRSKQSFRELSCFTENGTLKEKRMRGNGKLKQQPPRTLIVYTWRGYGLFGEVETMCYYSLKVIRRWFMNSTAHFRRLIKRE